MRRPGPDSRLRGTGVGRAVVAAAVLLISGCAGRTPAPTRTAVEPRFPDPKAAVAALVAACRSNDETALRAIFGEGSASLVSTGSAEADRERCARLVSAAQQMTRLDPVGADALELVVGLDDWPFPIPLVRDAQGWRFDTEQGAQAVVRRRIGANELAAIDVCRAYVRAQEAYAGTQRRGGAPAYAQRLVSTPGTTDGLHWPSTGTGDESPFGPAVAAAGDDAKGERPPRSWWGYHFRVLTGQGKHAPGGKRSYVVDGTMAGGFALVAYPAAYGETGIMTFVVSQDGRVYEKDLGDKTGRIVAAMKIYDPDGTWKLVTN
jgi:hypothetical protein